MKIAVLAGGISTEREISIVSGTMVCRALRERGHKAVLIDVFCGDETLPARGMAEGAADGRRYDMEAPVAGDGLCDAAALDGGELCDVAALDAGCEGCQASALDAGSELRDVAALDVSGELCDVMNADGSMEDPWFPEEYDVDARASYMRSFDGRIEEIRRTRREFFGPNVIALCEAADVVFMALHGRDGEDGKVQAVLDLFGIPYTGAGTLGSAVAMDKGLSRKLFAANGVPSAKGIILSRQDERKTAAENGIGLPCIVKPCCGGSSIGVEIARSEEEYQNALQVAFSYEEEIVVEQYIEGREFSVGVVDGEAYPVIELAPIVGFYDYKNKYEAGSTIETCPAHLSPEKTEEMQHYAKLAYDALKLSCYGRMDFMMDADENLYCLEANTLPGMTPTSLLPQEAAAIGISFGELCEKLIEVSLRGAVTFFKA